jgi:hypothetical protein
MAKWKERWTMLDRVVGVLVAVVLLLFSAASALACSECHCDTARCLATLDAQAEEVITTDLEALISSLDLEREVVENASQCSYWTTIPDNAKALEYQASGAAGVDMDSRNTRPTIEGAKREAWRCRGPGV